MLSAPTRPPTTDTPASCPADDAIRGEALRLLDAGLSPRRTAQRLRCGTVARLAVVLAPAGVTVSGLLAGDWPVMDAAVELAAFDLLLAGRPFTQVARELDLPIEHVQRLWDLA